MRDDVICAEGWYWFSFGEAHHAHAVLWSPQEVFTGLCLHPVVPAPAGGWSHLHNCRCWILLLEESLVRLRAYGHSVTFDKQFLNNGGSDNLGLSPSSQEFCVWLLPNYRSNICRVLITVCPSWWQAQHNVQWQCPKRPYGQVARSRDKKLLPSRWLWSYPEHSWRGESTLVASRLTLNVWMVSSSATIVVVFLWPQFQG